MEALLPHLGSLIKLVELATKSSKDGLTNEEIEAEIEAIQSWAVSSEAADLARFKVRS